MQDQRGARLAQLARLTGARLRGDGDVWIEGVATLERAVAGQITFLANQRYRRYLADTTASAVILNASDATLVNIPVLVSENPYLAFARIAQHLHPDPKPTAGIHRSAWVHPKARIAKGVSVGAHAAIGAHVRLEPGVVIGSGCVIGDSVCVGEGSRLMANVTVYDGVRIGQRARIHSGVVIGADGFGFANEDGRWIKVPQIGHVVIGDDVEIGANTAIDRGALEDTVIEDGVKLDNLVQIGHNVRIGAHTAIASKTGISGSTNVGRYCTIGGAVGMAGHLNIADGTVITGMSRVTHDIRESGVYSSGTPMAPSRTWRRNAARFNQLDDMARRLGELGRRLAAFEETDRKKQMATTTEPREAGSPDIDIYEILNYLPHRYPFLLVDRVLECRPGERVVGIKNVTINEPFFSGHFPQRPVMPGVLILEAMAQACGLLAFRTEEARPQGRTRDPSTLFYLVGIDKAKFKRPVEPGDQLRLEVTFIRNMRGIWMFEGEARVDGAVAASAAIRCTMREV